MFTRYSFVLTNIGSTNNSRTHNSRTNIGRTNNSRTNYIIKNNNNKSSIK
jgi:hypothetical protein